jgi:hypothetical protein
MIYGCNGVLADRDLPGRAYGVGARGCVSLVAAGIADHAALVSVFDPALITLTWRHYSNRGIHLTPARPEQWTLSVAHTAADVDAYVGVFDELVGELFDSRARLWAPTISRYSPGSETASNWSGSPTAKTRAREARTTAHRAAQGACRSPIASSRTRSVRSSTTSVSARSRARRPSIVLPACWICAARRCAVAPSTARSSWRAARATSVYAACRLRRRRPPGQVRRRMSRPRRSSHEAVKASRR